MREFHYSGTPFLFAPTTNGFALTGQHWQAWTQQQRLQTYMPGADSGRHGTLKEKSAPSKRHRLQAGRFPVAMADSETCRPTSTHHETEESRNSSTARYTAVCLYPTTPCAAIHKRTHYTHRLRPPRFACKRHCASDMQGSRGNHASEHGTD